jgi:hypothetical protein
MNTATALNASFHLDQHAHSIELRPQHLLHAATMAVSQASYLHPCCQKWISWKSSTAAAESTHSSYVMAKGVGSKNLSLSTAWNKTSIGLVALASHMEHPCGKLETVQNKMGRSKLNVRR